MREIKFRAWDKKQQKFVDDKQIKKNFNQYYKQPNSVIMQFTGLKDENGIEIYEGDILECYDSLTGSTFTGVVKFANGSFMVDSVSITHYRWVDYVREIIGNIHETPEILRSEADA